MAIKKFDDPTPKDDNTKPKRDEAVENSPFNPWMDDKPKRSSLGERAWAKTSKSSGKYTDNAALAEALLVKATESYAKVETLVKLYEKASKNPTRENVTKYGEAVRDIVSGETEDAAAIVSVLVATLYSIVTNRK